MLCASSARKRISSSEWLSSSDATWAVVPPVSHPPLCPCCVTMLSHWDKNRYLKDLPNFWSYISHKFQINLAAWWHSFGEIFPFSGQGWIPVLPLFSDWKQKTLLPFCRFKVNLSVLIAVFQLHMRNEDTERNQARFTTKTYRYHLGVKFWITSLC